MDLDKFSQDPKSISCNCKYYSRKFFNEECGHVLTGNLQIIQNEKLRKIFTKGPKFREPEKIDWEEAKTTIHFGIDSFINNLA